MTILWNFCAEFSSERILKIDQYFAK